MSFRARLATPSDLPVLAALIDASVRQLQTNEYTPSQIDCALATVYGTDTQLIADGTYYVVEAENGIVACGGWSKRRTLYGGDRCTWSREDSLLNPVEDAAKIRAFFVHPAWIRRGIASLLLDICEGEATAAGFSRFEMGATLTGVPMYLARGYVVLEHLAVPMVNGEGLPVVHMEKRITSPEMSASS